MLKVLISALFSSMGLLSNTVWLPLNKGPLLKRGRSRDQDRAP